MHGLELPHGPRLCGGCRWPGGYKQLESAGFKNADLALTPGQVLENIHAVQRQQIPHSGLRPHAGYRIFSRSPPSSEADCGGVFVLASVLCHSCKFLRQLGMLADKPEQAQHPTRRGKAPLFPVTQGGNWRGNSFGKGLL